MNVAENASSKGYCSITRTKFGIAITAALILALIVIGIFLSMPALESGANPIAYAPGSITSSSSTFSSSNLIQHAIVIYFENAGYSSVTGVSYFASLQTKYNTIKDYYGVSHPSEPNYLALNGGGTWCINDYGFAVPSGWRQCSDGNPSSTTIVSATDFAHDRIDPAFGSSSSAGWRAYAENMPRNCYLTTSSDQLYAPKHVPFLYFSNIVDPLSSSSQGSSYCQSHVLEGGVSSSTNPVPNFFSDLAKNVFPRFVFIAPNLCDDAHNCSLSTSATWLNNFLSKLQSFPASADTVVFLVFDEHSNDNLGFLTYNSCSPLGSGCDVSGGHTYAIIIGPPKIILSGIVSTTNYSEYSVLLTLEKIFSLSNLGGNNAAPNTHAMCEFFTTTARGQIGC